MAWSGKRIASSMVAGILLVLVAVCSGAAAAATASGDTGVLVVAPDRGFLGNEEVRAAFDGFAQGRKAQLLFMTDQRSEAVLATRLDALRQAGARRIAVLPLFLGTVDPRWQSVRGWLATRHRAGEVWVTAPPYGASYLAVEDLAARLRNAHAGQHRLLVLGYGADNARAATAMAAALKRIAGFATTLAPEAIDVVVYPRRRGDATKALADRVDAAIKGAHDTLVVPLAFAPRDDSMMDFSNWFANDVPGDAHLLASPIATTGALAQWMRRAANQAALQFDPLAGSQVGVVVLAHGADWFWNRDIRHALAPVAANHKLAWAFSMADPVVVKRAIGQLEGEHVRAIVVVRAFSMASSFLPTVQRMLGLDVENASDGHAHAGGHDMMMGHGAMAHGSLAAPPRIRSDLPIVTVGGVGDDPLFAKALVHNARSVSQHPSRETVILVAHGQGDDAANQRWLKLLASLAGQMRADGGQHFRAIEYATWREDWPDKRGPAVRHVRKLVEKAERNHGRALIVPARINRRGNAGRYLKGLDFGWSEGFAQTPYFAQWFEQEIRRGVRLLDATMRDAAR